MFIKTNLVGRYVFVITGHDTVDVKAFDRDQSQEYYDEGT